VEDVPGAVEQLRIGRRDETAAEERELGARGRSAEQRREPVRMRERIGVDERDPVALVGEPDGEVVRGREPDVLAEADDLDAGVALL